MTEPIRISYFSDVLCVWAYIAQIRIDELLNNFPDQVSIDYHFLPVFGNTYEKLNKGWQDRGGLEGYSNHVNEVAEKFEHITVNSKVWRTVTPNSSTSCHLFLHAVELLERKGIIPNSDTLFQKITWAFREAFFVNSLDIGDRQVQFDLAEQLGLPTAEIQSQIDSGEAYALLSGDINLIKENSVNVSPTLIFNEGRQRLNGNVGYRVIEANIRELLNNPAAEQSWC